MCGQRENDQLEADIGDAFSEFFGRIIENFEAVAALLTASTAPGSATALADQAGNDSGSADIAYCSPPATTGAHRAGR
jgi:hypothetical protein